MKICDVYKKGKMFIKDNLPDLEPPKNFGFGVIFILYRWEYLLVKQTYQLVKLMIESLKKDSAF